MRPLLLSLPALLLLPILLPAQAMTTVSTKWNDSFVEWEVYALMPVDTTADQAREKSKKKKTGKKKGGLTKPKNDPEPDQAPTPPPPDSLRSDEGQAEPPPMPLQEQRFGEFRLRWLDVRDDWSEWDFELGDQRGTIRAKWKDDPTQWELRTYSGAIVSMRAMWPNDNTQWRITDNSISLNFKSRWTNQLDEWLTDDTVHGRFYLYTLRQQDPRDWAIEDKLEPSISQPMKMALVFLTVFQSTPRR